MNTKSEPPRLGPGRVHGTAEWTCKGVLVAIAVYVIMVMTFLVGVAVYGFGFVAGAE